MKLINIKQNICNLELTGNELWVISETLRELYAKVAIEIDEQKFKQRYRIDREEVINIYKTIAQVWANSSGMNDIISMELSKRELYIIWVIFNDIRRGYCIEVDMEEYPIVCGVYGDELQVVTDEINKLYAQVTDN